MIKPTTIGEGILKGIPKPDVFQTDLLLTGKVHHLFNKAEGAKTWIALWLGVQALARGQTVVYLDMENGRRTISERLQNLDILSHIGSAEKIDGLFKYYDFPSFSLHHTAVTDYLHILEQVQPDLIIFDSWVNFLAGCGLDESNNTDVTNWARQYLFPARQREITTIVLDHVGHDGKRARGGSRKKDEVDVQWKVTTKHFNRNKIGEVNFKREKDRESFLPERVAFKVGGSPFIFERTDAKEETPVQLRGNNKKLCDFLVNKRDQGATYKELVDHMGGKSAVSYSITELKEKGLAHQPEQGSRYYACFEPCLEPEMELLEEEVAA